jgi:hypothetical protein
MSAQEICVIYLKTGYYKFARKPFLGKGGYSFQSNPAKDYPINLTVEMR